MIEEQLVARGIQDKAVLEAMSRVKRHLFVPMTLQSKAYEDTALPIGMGQTISQPYMVAFMTEILQLNHRSRVLEIGTGSGYQTAVLAEICQEVYTIEVIELLSKRASTLLDMLNYQNIHYKIGDGYQGWEEFAPYDAILVTCAPTHIPNILIDQIIDLGLIVLPVGETNEQKLLLLEKKRDKIVQKSIFQVKFVPMINKKGISY